jgi:pSer/pThr/pTyr-binding forkhead associated (FHA) protein
MPLAYLTTTDKRLNIKKYPINRAEFIIGRSSEADLHIQDDSVSRRHAKITYRIDTGKYYITDLESKNGTRIKGRRIKALKPKVLEHHARILFADYRFIFHDVDPTADKDLPEVMEGLCVDSAKRQVWVDGEEIETTKQEFIFLEVLYNQANQVVDYGNINDALRELEYGAKSEAARVQQIKSKLGKRYERLNDLIDTISGEGYLLKK